VPAIGDRAWHVLRLGGTRPTFSPSSADRSAAPFSGRSGQPRVDSSQQFIVASQRGVIMRGRKRSRLGPPTRTADVVPHVQDASIDTGAQTDASLRVLVRLLARQAAREVFEQSVSDSDCPFEEGRE
jgi:hypothetical protein